MQKKPKHYSLSLRFSCIEVKSLSVNVISCHILQLRMTVAGKLNVKRRGNQESNISVPVGM